VRVAAVIFAWSRVREVRLSQWDCGVVDWAKAAAVRVAARAKSKIRRMLESISGGCNALIVC